MSEALRRAVQTLDVLARADSDLSIRELAEATTVSKSAVQRILSSLVETGLAVQDPSSRRYGLGPRTLVLGTAYQRRIDLRAVALPHMTHLRDVTGETVGLSVRVGDELLHVEQVESGSALRRSFEIGRTLPLWCGAPSRLFLGDLSDAEREGIVRGRRPSAVVPAAPPSAEGLLAAVRGAASRGRYRLRGDHPRREHRAAALHGADGQVAATLSITGPSTRLDGARSAGACRCCGRPPRRSATGSATVPRLRAMDHTAVEDWVATYVRVWRTRAPTASPCCSRPRRRTGPRPGRTRSGVSRRWRVSGRPSGPGPTRSSRSPARSSPSTAGPPSSRSPWSTRRSVPGPGGTCGCWSSPATDAARRSRSGRSPRGGRAGSDAARREGARRVQA